MTTFEKHAEELLRLARVIEGARLAGSRDEILETAEDIKRRALMVSKDAGTIIKNLRAITPGTRLHETKHGKFK